MDEYKLPNEIDSKIPEAFYYALAGKLFAVFGPVILDDHDGEYYDFDSGTAGWYEAFAATCRELHLDWFLDYYNSLDWIMSDQLDGIIEDRIAEKVMKNFCNANAYYKFLISEREKYNKEKPAEQTERK